VTAYGDPDREAAIPAAYDFDGLAKIVDVAGGHGTLLRGILERYPRCSITEGRSQRTAADGDAR
jgi:O-methyltransferase domain